MEKALKLKDEVQVKSETPTCICLSGGKAHINFSFSEMMLDAVGRERAYVPNWKHTIKLASMSWHIKKESLTSSFL